MSAFSLLIPFASRSIPLALNTQAPDHTLHSCAALWLAGAAILRLPCHAALLVLAGRFVFRLRLARRRLRLCPAQCQDQLRFVRRSLHILAPIAEILLQWKPRKTRPVKER